MIDCFEQHGFIENGLSGKQHYGVCPFCGKTRFYVHEETTQWDCKTCGRTGNSSSFLTQVCQYNETRLRGETLKMLVENRGCIKAETFQAWGVGWNGRQYTIPCHGNDRGAIKNVKRFVLGGKALATKGCHLTGIVARDEKWLDTGAVYLCEGEWDAMVFWQALHRAKLPGHVLALPGAGVLPEDVLSLLVNREINILFDNDDAGQKGMEKLCKRLSGSISVLTWGPSAPKGADIRDLGATLRGSRLVNHVTEHLKLYKKEEGKPKVSVQPLGMSEVLAVFRKWLKMPSAEPIDVMFGVLLANRLVEGDPIWLFIVAPPGGMKTELLLSLNNIPEVLMTTTLTPHALISGTHMANGDPSLIPKLNGKVLVIKDFTAILGMNSIPRDEIFGLLRDVYDGTIVKYFGNGIVREYTSKFGILAGVTPIIETVSSANTVLGERFLKYKLPRTGRHIYAGRDAIRQALDNLRSNDKMRLELSEAALRGASVSPALPEIPNAFMEKFMGLAQWIATLRGAVSREKYTGQVQFKPVAEIGTRLAKQLLKMAFGIGAWRREDTISETTYKIITNIACHTIPDRVEEVVRNLFVHAPEKGLLVEDLALRCHLPSGTIRFLVQDMALLRILEPGESRGMYRLQKSVFGLMKTLELYKEECQWKKRRNG